MLKIGIKHTEKLIISTKHTAKSIQSGGIDVLASPVLIGLMEKCAWKSVLSFMEQGYDTVGTSINMHHLYPSPINAKIHCESKLIAVNNRELVFQINAYHNDIKIAEATHNRFIINIDRFMKKVS